MTTAELRESHARLLAILKAIVAADDVEELTQGLIESGRSAIAAAERLSEEGAWSIVP